MQRRSIMDLTSISRYCLSQKGTAATYPFGEDMLVMKVASKMYAIIWMHHGQLCISLKCDPFIAEALRQQHASVIPGYHLNKKHWNTVRIDGSIEEEELQRMIDHSYDLVFKGLTRAEKNRIVQL
jgi:predicted DNA-binding protein (MmcQ/YjbR family)